MKLVKVLGLICLVAPSITMAASKLFLGVTVFTVASTNSDWGGCFSKVSLPASTLTAAGLTGCAGNFVSFACVPGDTGISKSSAQRTYGNAQLGYVLQSPVNMLVTDDFTFNGYCTATRVDNAPR
jgi:hypothetical protein